MGQIKNIKLHIVTDIKSCNMDIVETKEDEVVEWKDYTYGSDTIVSPHTNKPYIYDEALAVSYTYWCNLCHVKLNTAKSVINHFTGQRHRAKCGILLNVFERKSEGEVDESDKKSKVDINCEGRQKREHKRQKEYERQKRRRKERRNKERLKREAQDVAGRVNPLMSIPSPYPFQAGGYFHTG